MAAFSATAAPAGSSTSFDGRASSDVDGSIARYDWNFGDGSAMANGGPTPTHTYASAGSYTVTLTATDDGGCSTALVFTGQTAACNGTSAAVTRRIVSVPSPPPPPPRVVTKFVLLGAPRPSSTAVSLSLVCRAVAGVVCRGLAQLTTTERLLGGKILALSARHRPRNKRVLIGSARFRLAAARRTTIVVPLNATGVRLLARFHRIPATLRIVLLGASTSALITAKVSIRAKHKRKRL